MHLIDTRRVHGLVETHCTTVQYVDRYRYPACPDRLTVPIRGAIESTTGFASI
jgi:hypothetical protein